MLLLFSLAVCSAPEHRQFDFWVGDWTVMGADGKLAGTNTVERLLDGCVIAEHWTGAGGTHGTSLNAYDSTTKRWHQTWVDDRGTVLLLDGRFAHDTMTLTNGTTTINRIRWTREHGDADRVRQIWDLSPDGGKTWQLLFNGLYVRRAKGT
jgi:hypothetical protein